VELHSLLNRQLKRFFGNTEIAEDSQYRQFIEAVNLAYCQSDDDRKMLERSFDMCSNELLQKSSELGALFKASPDSFFHLDNYGNILDYSIGKSALSFLIDQNLLNKNVNEILSKYTRLDINRAIENVLINRMLFVDEFSIIENSGDCYYEIRLFPTLENQIIAVIRDITNTKHVENALRSNEERLRTILDSTPVAMFLMDVTTRKVVYSNHKFTELFGYQLEEISSPGEWSLRAYPDPEYRQKIIGMRKINENTFSVQDAQKPLEIMITCKDGTVRYVTAAGTITSNQMIMAFNDITERKKAEEDKLKLEANLQQMQKFESLGVLAGGIAHDFNNILTGILGFISFAKISINKDNPIFEMLVEAENASIRAKDLTQQLLAFAKGGVGTKKITSMGKLIKDTSSFVLRGSKVKCHYSIPDNLWNAEIDEGQIGQVIQNIVINANEAMPQGGEIEITCNNSVLDSTSKLTLAPGKYIQIVIKDKGTGIPSEQLTRIFDPYFTTKKKGSGLGLAISYSIVRNHGGLVTVASEVGNGTTFSIFLLATEEKAVVKQPAEIKQLTGKGKILVLDDEDVIQKLVNRILTRAGFEVTFTSDGKETIKQYENAKRNGHPFDLVIVDLTIPGGMGGTDVVKTLRETNPAIKAIVSSGYSEDSIMANYRQYGFNAVVPKPYTTNQLVSAVNSVLEN
jgi:two-component system, cell cycle sensor histidine kinase and response regulator CckA